jgi:hypothetical protein
MSDANRKYLFQNKNKFANSIKVIMFQALYIVEYVSFFFSFGSTGVELKNSHLPGSCTITWVVSSAFCALAVF